MNFARRPAASSGTTRTPTGLKRDVGRPRRHPPAWADRRDAEAPERAYHGAALLILKELAKGQPVTPARAAELVVGLTEAQAVVMFRRAAERGAELDESGSLIGNALTLKPTGHRFRVSGHQLYAWCSLDTLFLPALLEQDAKVESECPLTGETLSLVVGPEGVRSCSPDTMRASVVIPGSTPACDIDSTTGPRSPTCSQMRFFATAQAAKTWAADHPGTVILTIDEASDVARTFTAESCSDCC